ncbi:uncharacterized protein LOC122368883 [Amphibalanus amphitrite]|uniref:uncharacterized protein LOC122368883 n=1 Tax=Amphibalanus amphitrite TaxID=1232801 RepID=UPI001C910163|nr:uncharacterized protein LOC122368883 [Amphibalanus amphitrite]
MGVFRGEPPRPRWLPRLLMASLVLNGVVLGRPSGQPAVCGRSCCSVLPSCEYAKIVTCDCPDLDKTIIRKGDVPATAREVTIRRPRHVILEEDTIGGLPFLENFTVSDVGQLEIRRGVVLSEIPTSLRWLKFFRIDSVIVEPMAFFDPREVEQVSITFHQIGLLVIETNAFDMFLEDLVLKNVEDAYMRPEGFFKSVSMIELNNVSIEECHQGSFGQNSRRVMWTDVTMEEAKPGCITFRDGATFDVLGLRLNTVKTKAFSGNPRKVVIRDSQLGHLYENAFHLRLTKFTFRNVEVGTLHPFSLHISSKGPVYIDHVRIDEMQRDALRGIRLESPAPAKLLLIDLEILSAENSSFALSKTIKDRSLNASRINVKSRPIPVCPNEKYARFLTGVGDTGQMTPAQSKISEALTGNIFCDSFEWEGSEDFERPMVETAQDTSVEPKDGHGPGNRPKGNHEVEEADISAADTEDEYGPTKHVEEEQRPGHDAENASVSSNGVDDLNRLQDRTRVQDRTRSSSSLVDDQRPTADSKDDQGPKADTKDDHRPTADTKNDHRPTADTKNDHGPTADTKDDHSPTADTKEHHYVTANTEDDTTSVEGTKNDDVSVRDADDGDDHVGRDAHGHHGFKVGVAVAAGVLAVLIVGLFIWKLLKNSCPDYSPVANS